MIYLDNNATTRLLPEVLAAMMPYFGELYGNPSSIHLFAEQSREALRQSRVAVGRLIGSRPEEIVFTSGATEACNLAIFGAAAARPERRHIVVSSVEHHAVLHPIERLRAQGYEVTVLSVSSSGGLTAGEVAGADALEKGINLVRIAAGDQFHAAVREVFHCAGDIVFAGEVFHGVAEADTLHAAFVVDAEGFHFRIWPSPRMRYL